MNTKTKGTPKIVTLEALLLLDTMKTATLISAKHTQVEQDVFDNIKISLSKETLLNYPDF